MIEGVPGFAHDKTIRFFDIMLAKTWLLLCACSFAEMVYQVIIFSSLLDFETDHVNPLDLCNQLEKSVNPILGISGAISFISMFGFGKAWMIVFAHIGIIGALLYVKRSRKNRVFDAMLIVRDMSKIKTRHMIFIGIEVLTIVYCLIQAIITALM